MQFLNAYTQIFFFVKIYNQFIMINLKLVIKYS